MAAWSLYDFANSAYTTLVVTFVYSTYFTKAMAADEVVGTAVWSRGVAGTALAVAILSPYVGAIADRGGYRKRFLFFCTTVCIAGTALLTFPAPGQIWLGLALFVVSNVAFEMGNVFYNAYLPDIAPLEKIGRISGYGWALGYFGGLVCLAIALLGFVSDQPWFGLSTAQGANIRAANMLVAVWFTVFSIPLFVFVKDRAPIEAVPSRGVLRRANRELVQTFHSIRQYRQVVRFLLAKLIYNDGLVTVFAFGGIYAAGTFGLSFQEITIFGIVLNVAAGLGAFAFGFLDDVLGGKPTILISLVGLIGFTLLALLTPSVFWFWVAGIGIGLLVGPNQSASRSLMGRLVPPDKTSEFYGFYAFSGKATAFMGPFLFGTLTLMFDSQRAGMASLLLFFGVGIVLLLRVDEAEGYRLAGHGAEAAGVGM